MGKGSLNCIDHHRGDLGSLSTWGSLRWGNQVAVDCLSKPGGQRDSEAESRGCGFGPRVYRHGLGASDIMRGPAKATYCRLYKTGLSALSLYIFICL